MSEKKARPYARVKPYATNERETFLPHVRLTKLELQRYTDAWERSGEKSFSEWIRRALDAASR